MGIKSLQVTQSSVHEGLSCIGKIRKGAPKVDMGNGRTRMGADLDFFRFTAEPEFAGAERAFADLYGDKPTCFDPVFIIGETVEDAFNPWMEEWKATALLHRCDEETQVLSYNTQSEMYVRARITCEKLQAGHSCGCKPVGRLSLLMPELMVELGVSGYVSVETHSVNDILSLQHALNAAVAMTGRITGVAFIFGRAPEKISARITDKQGNARRVNTTKSLFFLRPNEDYTRNNLLPELAASGNRPLFGNEPMALAQLPEITGSTALERLQGDRTKPRRIGGPVVVSSAPVEANEPPAVDPEIVEEDDGPKPWTNQAATAWVKKKRAESFTDKQLLEALGVEKFGDFPGGVEQADLKFKAWFDAQLEPKQEAVS